MVNFWDNVYGFSMKCMKKEVLKEAFVETVPNEKIVTNSCVIKEIDLKTCNVSACIFSSKFSFKVTKDCILTAIVGYFDVFFELDCKIEFSTGPHAEKTHWQQTLFFLGDTITLKEGEFIFVLLFKVFLHLCTKFARYDVEVKTKGNVRNKFCQKSMNCQSLCTNLATWH